MPDVGGDLATLLARAQVEADRAGAVNRADAIATAARRLRGNPDALPARAVLLLDVPVVTAAESGLLDALVVAASI